MEKALKKVLEKPPSLKSVSTFIFYLFYLALNANLAMLIYLPLYILELIYSMNGRGSQSYFLSDSFAFLGLIILAVLSYKIISRSKDKRSFFINTTFIFSLSYGLYFSHLIYDIVEFEQYILFFILLVIILLLSLLISWLWQEIFINKRYKLTYLVPFIFILDAFFIYLDFVGSASGMSFAGPIYKTYKSFGGYVNELTNHQMNIFYLDYDGFAVIFINAINSFIVFLALLLSRFYTKNSN